jgi:putative hydrolase of the HAD superfamily
VVRNAGAERELTMMRWGMPPPPESPWPPVTNIRNTSSPHWRVAAIAAYVPLAPHSSTTRYGSAKVHPHQPSGVPVTGTEPQHYWNEGWFAPTRRVSRSGSVFVQAAKMIQAVILDFGGVLTTSPFEAFARFEAERGLPLDIIRRTNAANHLENAWAKFERAEINAETFDELFAAESRALGVEVRGSDVLPLLSGDLRPEMVEALRRVKARFKTGCITNNLSANSIGSRAGRSLYVAEVMAFFDHVIESAKIGLRKPDPRIYRLMTEKLGVDPNDCVYLDDLGVNLKPAREMGMKTIKVVNASQAISELEAAIGLPLS